MDACRGPTGVTRHALAQLDRLRRRPDVALSLVSGRIGEPDGLAFWEGLGDLPRKEMPLRTRDMLRAWRFTDWPPAEWWAGPVDWVYAPAEYYIPTRSARAAVDEPRRLAGRHPGRPAAAGLASPRFLAGPTGSCRSRRSTPRGSPSTSRPRRGTRSPTCRTRPTTSSSSRPDVRRAGRGPGRPGAAGRDAVSALGGELPAEEEPAEARPRGGPAGRGRAGELALVLLGDGDEPGRARSARRSPRSGRRPW